MREPKKLVQKSNTSASTGQHTVKLSRNDRKGLAYEIRVQNLLKRACFNFKGNPIDPESWKKNISYGKKNSRSEPDVFIPSLYLPIEVKYVKSPVWASGIQENYIKRFHNYRCRRKVVVTNNLKMYNEDCKRQLREAGVTLIEINQLRFCLSQLRIELMMQQLGIIKDEVEQEIEIISREANTISSLISYYRKNKDSNSVVPEYYEDPSMVLYSTRKAHFDPLKLALEQNVGRESERIFRWMKRMRRNYGFQINYENGNSEVKILATEQSDSRRLEIEHRIEEITQRLFNPEAFHIGTRKLSELEEEKKRLLEEYNHLPPETKYYGKIALEENVAYEGAIPIKRDQYGRFFCPEDSLIAGIHTEITVDEKNRPIKAVRCVCNSDTRGRTEKRLYDFVINPMKPLPPKTPILQTATKKEEGNALAHVNDDTYMKGMGFVKDSPTGRWRRPTPQEFCKMRDKQKQ